MHDAAGGQEIIPLAGISGQFPTQLDKFRLAYAESVSSVDFMVRHYGRDALAKLIQTYAAGVTDDQALKTALGADMAAFSAAWLADIGRQLAALIANLGRLPRKRTISVPVVKYAKEVA